MSVPAEHMPRLEKYELLEELGHGGMATVYRARDRRLGRDVAVKVIHRHLRESVEVGQRFTSEAHAVAKLRHPNIVEVYDVSDDGEDERYLVVELVRGPTLRKLVAEHGHMPAEVAAAVALEVAAALEHAHEQGVIHRDVKPENVLVDLPRGATSARPASELTQNGRAARVKITDFGIAKLLDAQGVTSTGQVLGSPAHMAPEQIEGGDVDARADVFGLGVLLYECMVGKLPFEGKNPAQVLRRVLDGTYTPAERARHTVGTTWSAIVDKALARDAEARWESASALAEALRAELGRLGFDDPRRELSEYLDGPEKYVEAYERRVVARLVERAKQARAARDPLLAASCFNRALAFRPDDAKLLGEVAGLARAARMRRVASRSAAVVGAAVLFGSLAFGVTRSLRSSRQDPARPGPARSAAPPPPRGHTSADRPIAAEPVDSAAPRPARSGPILHFPPHANAVPAVAKKGRVRVVIKGAGGGKVSVDGGPAESPFTKVYELDAGPHRFDFIPPNADCCEAPKPVFYTVTDSADLQFVSYEIKFRPAVLQLNGPAGTELTCAALFAGKLSAPGSRQVPMNNGPSLEDHCTMFPPPDSGAAPKPVDVHLRAGLTSFVSWP